MTQKTKMKKGRKRNNNNGMALVASGNGIFKSRCNVCGN